MSKLSNKWEEEFEKLNQRIAGVYHNEAGQANARKYLSGLLSDAERKNGWQLSEKVGESTPYALQQFLYRGVWSADALRDELRSYVAETLGSEEGVLVVDETGFLKQGKKSCGVKRQYSGTAGRVENCQIGVFLAYASSKGYAMMDRELYLPKEWTEDELRRKESGIPDEVVFQTKPQMALTMIREAHKAGVPFGWVAGDSVYGDVRAIREYCESIGKGYVLCVSGKESLWIGFEPYRVSELLSNLDADANSWRSISCGKGSKGERMYDWQMLALNSPSYPGFPEAKRSLLVRKSQTTGEVRAYVCWSAHSATIEEYVRIAGVRWTVETSFAETKSEVGLDEYEVHSYNGWYKHITLSCLAHAFLTQLSGLTSDRTMQQCLSSASNFAEFKRGRNLRG
jgi:SRSO17 transposase